MWRPLRASVGWNGRGRQEGDAQQGYEVEARVVYSGVDALHRRSTEQSRVGEGGLCFEGIAEVRGGGTGGQVGRARLAVGIVGSVIKMGDSANSRLCEADE